NLCRALIVMSVELSRCRGIGDRCKVGRSAGMITVRRDAVRTQGRAPKGGGDQRDREPITQRLSNATFLPQLTLEITGHTKPTFPYSNIRAVTLKLYSRPPSSRVEIRPS